MLFASNYIPKYLNNSEYDYDPSLNNVFHFGIDFSNFLINSSFNKSKFDLRLHQILKELQGILIFRILHQTKVLR